MQIKIKYILGLMAALVMLSACTPENIVYFQDMKQGGAGNKIVSSNDIRVRPYDKISILVNSKDPMLAQLFNLPVVQRAVGADFSGVGSTSGGGSVSSYTVNKEGNIIFPVVGNIKVGGMTREEIAAHVKEILVSKNLIKDPIITVEFANLAVSVMGEVEDPGRYQITNDKFTILDALSMAGDLTIYGQRENVMVLREENGVEKSYTINLCSAESIYSSPVYYLQQNDVVYVAPNDTKARESTVNGNNVRSASFWLSVATFLTSIAVLILI